MSHHVPQLRVGEVAGFVADQAAQRPLLLDVREGWEVATASARPAGADWLHIPMATLPARLHELDRSRPLLVMCHHGGRSQQCAAFLRQHGFDAHNVAGGIDAWSREVDPSVPRY